MKPVRKKRATLKDVAMEVGVHVSTVSRALDERTRHMITPDIVEQVKAASRRLDYQPNHAARSLKTNRTRIIGVVVPDITNPLFSQIIRGIEDALSVHDYLAIIVNTDSRLRREASVMEMLRSRGAEGMVVASVERRDEALEKMVEQGLPVVTVNRRAEDPGVASVISDEEAGVRLALDHLVGLGHRRIAAIAGPQSLSTGKDRYEALTRLFAAGPPGLHLSGVAFAEGFNETEGERCMNDLLATAPDFTAVIAANDRLAIGAISQIKAHRLRCPQDISVTGHNDMALVDRLDPPLTTIRVQQYMAGAKAAEILIGLIENSGGKDTAQHIVLPVDLVVRGSTAPPRESP